MVMRLSRVPALRALDTLEFYLRCDACDYTSGELTGIAAGEFACDILQEAEVAILAGTKSANQSFRAARLPLIRSTGSGADCVATGGPSNFDRPVPAPSSPDPAAMSVVTTFLVISAVAALLATYLGGSPSLMSFVGAPTVTPGGRERAVQSSLRELAEPSIQSKTATTGSATGPKTPTTLLRPKEDPTDAEMVVDPDDKTTRDSKSAKDQSSPFNLLAFHRNVKTTLDADDIQFSREHGTEFPAKSDMAAARPLSTGAANRSVVTEVTVNCSGFIFDESNVRYLSVAELDKLSPEQLRIARHEILARKGRLFKDPRLSVHFEKFPWYRPSVWRVRLNAIEQANVNLIWSIETSYHSERPEIAVRSRN
jgi:hypothetical protein